MVDSSGEPSLQPGRFSEKAFYLDEFRGRTLGIQIRRPEQASAALVRVLNELRTNRTRVVLISKADLSTEQLGCEEFAFDRDRIEGLSWRALRQRGRVVLRVAPEVELASAVQEIAERLALFKVILLGVDDGYHDSSGRRRSFVNRQELEQLLSKEQREPQAELLRDVRALLRVGVPNVNVCTPEGLHNEIFTYSGSGTLFTTRGHIGVRPLGIDDYDQANDLIERGVAEGFLAPRDEEAMDRLLPRSFGAFVEDQHLAGIGALLPYQEEECAEIASLYAVTRFQGEGIGPELVTFALEQARECSLHSVFACTTSVRAGEFFVKLGFERVDQDRVPERKWQGYDAERRERVSCFRLDLA